MRIVHDKAELRSFLGGVVVPTMGGLHEGHVALVRAGAAIGAAKGRPVVVTVFVNPTQFNDRSDYDRYPRTLDADAALCARADADAVFAPTVETVYPPGVNVPTPALPSVARLPGLEDRFRPGHFAGVCQVVRRLFDLTRPLAAVFGEKDWQQLQAVRAMTERDALGVEIVPHPTVREPDGLAMSSRNRFLTAQERDAALSLSRGLCAACAEADPCAAERVMAETMTRAGADVEYAAVRDARTLLPLSGENEAGARALVAARVGAVRLIDNAPWPGATVAARSGMG